MLKQADFLQNKKERLDNMYTNFQDLYKAYGFDGSEKNRDDLSLKEEENFVSDCFDTYEHIGFANVFHSAVPSTKIYDGLKFRVIGRVSNEIVNDDSKGVDLEALPMWEVEFENGYRGYAFPEEICLAEQTEFGYHHHYACHHHYAVV